MTEYGFRLVDRATNRSVRDWEWLTTPQERSHAIWQLAAQGEQIIEQQERGPLEIYDLVRIKGGDSRIFRIIGLGPGTLFKVQFETYASTWQKVNRRDLELVAKAKKDYPESEAGFHP